MRPPPLAAAGERGLEAHASGTRIGVAVSSGSRERPARWRRRRVGGGIGLRDVERAHARQDELAQFGQRHEELMAQRLVRVYCIVRLRGCAVRRAPEGE
jgi:hypothetical protein